MTLAKLSQEYFESAEPLRLRLRELNDLLSDSELTPTEFLLLQRRIYILTTMLRDTVSTAKYLKNYYGGNKHD